MRILAVETSGARGGIALAEGFPQQAPALNLIQEVRLAEGLRHGRDLILAASDACCKAGWDKRAFDLVAVSIGPGSFTGVRIAVTLAKFLAWDTGAKIVAVPSLRALAENAPPDRWRIATIVDANRGGLFASIFERRTEGGLEETFGPALIEPEDLARRILLCEAALRYEARVAPPAFVLGHGLTKGRAALAAFDLAPPDLWDIRPASVARLGFDLACRNQFADPLRLEPIYLRRPEAEELWERRKEKGPAAPEPRA
jgi:tRNA threonylcarbamoyladenosine biosynthesis protein TsaB